MINSVIFNLVISFVVAKLEDQGAAIDWAKIKEEFNAWVSEHLVRWSFLSTETQSLGDAFIDAAALALKDSASVKALLSAIVQKDFQGCIDVMKKFLVTTWLPTAGNGPGQQLLAGLLQADVATAVPAAPPAA